MAVDDGARSRDQSDINSPPRFFTAFGNSNTTLKIYEALARFTLVGPQEQPSDGFSPSFGA